VKIELHRKDALDFLEGIPDESVDVIVTDPPYWTLDKWRKMGTTTRLGGNRVEANQRPEMFFERIVGVLKSSK
jgi:site-specific DNA-methyltransferase (adenine-specific)